MSEQADYVRVLTPREQWDLFDKSALRNLGISGKDLMQRVADGENFWSHDHPQHVRAVRALMLMPAQNGSGVMDQEPQ